MTTITVKTYLSLANEITKYQRAGFEIVNEISGKEYTLTNGTETIKIIKKH